MSRTEQRDGCVAHVGTAPRADTVATLTPTASDGASDEHNWVDERQLVRLAAILGGEHSIFCTHWTLRLRDGADFPWWISRSRRQSFADLMVVMVEAPRHLAGMLKSGRVSSHTVERFLRETPLPQTVRDHLNKALAEYLGEVGDNTTTSALIRALANPLEWGRPSVSQMILNAVLDNTIFALYNEGAIGLDAMLKLIERGFVRLVGEGKEGTLAEPKNAHGWQPPVDEAVDRINTGELTKFLDAAAKVTAGGKP